VIRKRAATSALTFRDAIAGKIEDVDGDLVGERTPINRKREFRGGRDPGGEDGEGSARIQGSPEALKGLSG
jgi:hypothetical protein